MKRYLILGCLAVFTSIAAVSSGNAQSREFGVAQRSASWATNLTSEDRTLGIDTGSLTIITLKCGNPKGVTLAFWSDSSNGFSGTGSGQSDQATYEAVIRRAESSSVEISCITTDGVAAQVKIGEHEYDVTAFGLFLIDATSEELRVRRLHYPQSKLPKSLQPDALVKFANEKVAIRKFWRGPEPDAQEPSAK